MARILLSLFLVAIAVLGTLASTVPTNELHIKPHPDLPSLASLKVTPAQLYDMAVNLTNTHQDRRSTPAHDALDTRTNTYADHCDGKMCWPAGRLAAAGCVDYLLLMRGTPIR
ncbi:hypothetical protein GE09DRAFT_1066082 [Coniochaeta sp. 2T2.1]|nr:hypothetical protein GE09DRAFT_1066082 [Coniochaeta sp. 2T2.1]